MRKNQLSQVRIIAGMWRGRRLQFEAHAGLRPTPDRVRETLFNWLGREVLGARCVDCFAGSGALGFEALSRGAESVVMLDANPHVSANLQAQADKLGATAAQIYTCDYQALPQILAASSSPEEGPFNLVFLDPPFGLGLVPKALHMLQSASKLAPGAWVYTEIEKTAAPLNLPGDFVVQRRKQAGQVEYALWRYHTA